MLNHVDGWPCPINTFMIPINFVALRQEEPFGCIATTIYPIVFFLAKLYSESFEFNRFVETKRIYTEQRCNDMSGQLMNVERPSMHFCLGAVSVFGQFPDCRLPFNASFNLIVCIIVGCCFISPRMFQTDNYIEAWKSYWSNIVDFSLSLSLWGFDLGLSTARSG